MEYLMARSNALKNIGRLFCCAFWQRRLLKGNNEKWCESVDQMTHLMNVAVDGECCNMATAVIFPLTHHLRRDFGGVDFNLSLLIRQ